MEQISIIMPAYRAQSTIGESVRSCLGLTLPMELLIIADDGTDYQATLAQSGIIDPRIRFLSSTQIQSGSAAARNIGLDAANGSLIALLDADDLFLPCKLEALSHVIDHSFVSFALDVRRGGKHLRMVGKGPTGPLRARDYKFTNFSMDAMIAYDRRVGDPRLDEQMDCLTDLDLVMRLFAHHEHVFHIGEPAHAYCKQDMSISMGPEASTRYTRMKTELISKLNDGTYPMLDPEGPAGFARFLTVSLAAEQQFETSLVDNPILIFEDHLEPKLKSQELKNLR